VKLALTIIFFAIAFSQLNAAPSAIFGAYAVALISQAVAMAVLSYKASK
jgi:F0F1-type ATP synthase assembly protein I